MYPGQTRRKAAFFQIFVLLFIRGLTSIILLKSDAMDTYYFLAVETHHSLYKGFSRILLAASAMVSRFLHIANRTKSVGFSGEDGS